MQKRLFSIIALLAGAVMAVAASSPVRLTLEETIKIANDSSLSSFMNRNLYESSYWAYRNYRANRLPSLSLDVTPARYNRYIVQRYDSNENIDVFRAQQNYTASGGLSIMQNFDLTGGTFYIQSELEYLRNFGDMTSTQYSSIPLRIGYQQNLLGFNALRWERRIEPLKYEKAKKQLVYNMEQVAENAVNYFFSLALAQSEYRLAVENKRSCDTLYAVGERRFKIAAISKADLLTLQLDKVNASNNLENVKMNLKRAMFTLASFLGMEKETEIVVELPARPREIFIPVDEALAYAKLNNPTLLGHRQEILEAQREVNRTKVESMFSANLNASIGFNQVADNLGMAYRHLQRQDLVSLTISIPLIDWGVRKGKYNMARNNLDVARISSRQEEASVEEEVIMTVSDFSSRQRLVASAEEALDLAEMAYSQTRQRFIIGKADINSLTLSNSRQEDASRNYIAALQNYWMSYYKIRRITLYDFDMGFSLADTFDYNIGMYK